MSTSRILETLTNNYKKIYKPWVPWIQHKNAKLCNNASNKFMLNNNIFIEQIIN